MVRKFPLLVSVIGTAVGGVILFKEYAIVGRSYQGPERLEQKTAIVTGANTGIGKETAKAFAERGCRVILACRDLQKCEEVRREMIFTTNNRHVICRQLDLASLDSVRAFAERFNREELALHVLVNNAGVTGCPRLLTKDGFEMQLGVNHLGHFLLTLLLLDKLKASAPSRIINVSSVAHFRAKINFDDLNSEKNYDHFAAYGQSKLANVLFTKELARRVKDDKIAVFAVHPGLVNTDIARHYTFNNYLVSRMVVYPFMWLFLKNPRQGAQTTIHCALQPGLECLTGSYFSDCAAANTSELADDEVLARRLWATSEKWCRYTPPGVTEDPKNLKSK